MKAIVIKDYETNYPESLSFTRGVKINCGKKFNDDPDWKDWIWCTSERGVAAWVPEQIIQKNGDTAIIIEDYDAKELNITKGEKLTIIKKLNGFAFVENEYGLQGWVPLKNLKYDEIKEKSPS